MDQFRGDAVTLDVGVDLFPVVTVVAQRSENLCQGEVREVMRNLLGRQAKTPVLNNRADRRARAPNDRLAIENTIISSDVPLLGRWCHRDTPPFSQVHYTRDCHESTAT